MILSPSQSHDLEWKKKFSPYDYKIDAFNMNGTKSNLCRTLYLTVTIMAWSWIPNYSYPPLTMSMILMTTCSFLVTINHCKILTVFNGIKIACYINCSNSFFPRWWMKKVLLASFFFLLVFRRGCLWANCVPRLTLTFFLPHSPN